MSLLLYALTQNNKISKSALEIASYASAIANKTSEKVIALTCYAKNPEILGEYGVSKVYHIDEDKVKNFDTKYISNVLKALCEKELINTVIFDDSYTSKDIAPYLSSILEAEYISNIITLPEQLSPFVVKRLCFSSKAFSKIRIDADKKVLQILRNVFPSKISKTNVEVISYLPTVELSEVSILEKEDFRGKVAITDAEVVVSGGRGLKSPENWHIIETLADLLHGATACSKPVSDQGWRPHSEHVGQTGKSVSSKVYIAIGISGAIQHLAGISASKTKIVINNDSEAPFFKSADYGILGDAFKIVPELIEKLKLLK